MNVTDLVLWIISAIIALTVSRMRAPHPISHTRWILGIVVMVCVGLLLRAVVHAYLPLP